MKPSATPPNDRTISPTVSLLFVALASVGAVAPLRAGVFPGADWQQSSPDSQMVDAAKLTAALQYLKGKVGSNGITQTVVVRNGSVIWKGSDVGNRHNVWSVSKSFTSTVFGLLCDDGKCTPDSYAKQWVSALSSQYSGVKLKHFATHTSGYANTSDCQSTTPFTPSNPQFAPGTKFNYCDDAMNQFGNVLTRIAGEPLKSLFKRRIADKIGMTSWDWGNWGTVDGLVVNGGAGNKSKGISITAMDMARFGLLFLNSGNWNGAQLVSSAWVDAATGVQVDASVPPYEGTGGPEQYGYNWWTNGAGKKWADVPRGAYAALGFNNNNCFIIPEWNMVIVRLGTDGDPESEQVYNEFLKRVGEAIVADITHTRHGGEHAPASASLTVTRRAGQVRFENVPPGARAFIYSLRGERVRMTGGVWGPTEAAARGLYLYAVRGPDGAIRSQGTFTLP